MNGWLVTVFLRSYAEFMESVIRSVRNLPSDERRIYEAVLGHSLQENQRVVVSVMEGDAEATARHSALSRAVEIAGLGRAAAELQDFSDDEVDSRIGEAIREVRRSQQ